MELKKPKLRHICPIFFKLKLKEIFSDNKDGWKEVGGIFLTVTILIGGAILANIHPTFKKIALCAIVVIAILVGCLMAVGLSIAFYKWIQDNWKKAKQKARGKLYEDLPKCKDLNYPFCHQGPLNSNACLKFRLGKYGKTDNHNSNAETG